jgi:hypothetical protein
MDARSEGGDLKKISTKIQDAMRLTNVNKIFQPTDGSCAHKSCSL